MNKREAELQKAQDELLISKKRYEIALSIISDTVFDYVVDTKQIINFKGTAAKYGLPDAIDGGPEAIIAAGNIHPKSIERFRELYKRIDDGDELSSDVIVTIDKDGREIINEIIMHNIYDNNHKPTRAIGIMKNVTKSLQLQRERDYVSSLLSDKVLSYEANVTADKVVYYDGGWTNILSEKSLSSLTSMLTSIADIAVAPEHRELFLEKTSRQLLLTANDNGENMITFEFLIVGTNGPEWIRTAIHIIQDELTGEVFARSYMKKVNKHATKPRFSPEEQYYLDTMSAKAEFVYETNVTQNYFISGHENCNRLYSIEQNNDYTKILLLFTEKALHPADRARFLEVTLRENLIAAYKNDNTDFMCDYRKLNDDGDFIWCRSTIHLYENEDNSDVYGICCVENIDAEKKLQLELIYKAEHDLLTGMYNKITVEEVITDFLSTSDAKANGHAFLILDIDYFKSVNDTFGHAFGDTYLSQTATKIKSLFRDDDTFGRIGGDEFVVFMKNVKSEHRIQSKAEELCKILSETYTVNGAQQTFSVSIGIALYPAHGKTYDALYRNSDAALYYAKEHGRDQYAMFTPNMELCATAVKAIDNVRLPHTKIFEESICEYVFRILYEATDKSSSINTVLELIGKHYAASRVYIFEDYDDGRYSRNTFEWCAQGIPPEIENLQSVSYEELGTYKELYNSDGYFYLNDIDESDQSYKDILKPQGVKSLLHFSVEKNGVFVGFIGFDQCDRIRVPTPNELSECRNMANVLGIFITEMRAIEVAVAARLETEASKQRVMAIVNALGSYAYVCDPETYEVLFINKQLNILAPNAKNNCICYEAFWANTEPCKGCPINALREQKSGKYTTEMYNHNLKRWVKVTTSWIDWLDNKKTCLVESVDITKYITGTSTSY
ncbi:MAG: diguanylate cyclase [Oscillospiraceae bacterium]